MTTMTGISDEIKMMSDCNRRFYWQNDVARPVSKIARKSADAE
jgi:hypothetical protein